MRVEADRHDAEALVRRILPVMAERRERIGLGRRPVHVGDRPERRLADRRDVERLPRRCLVKEWS